MVYQASSNSNSNLTYRDLKLRGFSGTKYDAELMIQQGSIPSKISLGLGTSDVKQDVFQSTSTAAASDRGKQGAAAFKRKSRRDLDVSFDREELTVTVRSLRNTPGRLRARCERGRAASDSSSSGISDDASSSSSGSDRDSGIETSAEFEGVVGPPSTRRPFGGHNNNSGEVSNRSHPLYGVIENGVSRMNLGESAESPTTPSKFSHGLYSSPNAGGHLKMTLRAKRSPVLDEVLESYTARAEVEATSPTTTITQLTPKKRSKEYEVLKMEGLSEEQKEASAKTSKRKKPDEDKRPVKRLRLLLGSETMSTIQFK